MKKELIAVAIAMALTGCGGAAASNESTISSTEATVESTTAAAAESVSTEDLVAKVLEPVKAIFEKARYIKLFH